MREAQLREALTDLANQGVPGEPDLWPEIRSHMVEVRNPHTGRPVMQRRTVTRPRPAWTRVPSRAGAFALALAALLLLGTAYATLPLIQQSLSGSPEGEQMLAYGKIMHLSRTVAGFTVSLDFAYADREGGLLGYTITAPSGRAFNSLMGRVQLTTPQGTDIPITGGSGTGVQAGLSGNFVGFGGLPRLDGRKEVPLRLTVESIEIINPDGSSADVPGPWVFDFTAPVAPTRLVEPHQTVVADGWGITLESITMTPPATWVTLRGAGPNADVELIAGGKSYHLYQDGGAWGPEVKACFAEHRRCPELWQSLDTRYVAVAMEPSSSLINWLRGDKPGLQEDKTKTAEWMRELSQAHGEWTIVVNPDRSVSNPIFELQGGPWVFHVRMP